MRASVLEAYEWLRRPQRLEVNRDCGQPLPESLDRMLPRVVDIIVPELGAEVKVLMDASKLSSKQARQTGTRLTPTGLI
jgi:hypothetical protein